VKLPIDPNKRCTPLSEWPASHRAAWTLALQPQDLFQPSTGYATRWATATQAMIEKGYGRWLGWLELTGRLNPLGSPADHATRENVAAYLDTLQGAGLAGYTVAGLLQQLSNTLKAIAQDGDWVWIQRASSRLHSAAQPVRDVNSRIQPAQDVLTLGYDLMRLAEQDRFRTDLDRAKMFRDGLIIALLILRPLRSANLCSITIGQHLQLSGEQWRLSFDAGETKGRKPIDCSWPDQLVGSLERYIAVHRQVLIKLRDGSITTKSSAALWISTRGDQMGPDAISVQVGDRTEQTFGTAINLHSFRHMAATTIATADPEGVTDIMEVLAHSTMRTSEVHYNRAKMIDAARIYHETIRQLRRKPTPVARRTPEETS
jgi:integrase/recombinase XerD